MVSLPVYDASGSEVGKYEIDPAEISPTINKQLLHDVVVMYQASKRQGSHKSKSRAEVAGANKKMYRQKGTGNARAGSRRSGIRRGGGHIASVRCRVQRRPAALVLKTENGRKTRARKVDVKQSKMKQSARLKR